MCGGWRTVPSDYKPTPQPGDFVQIWVCAKCSKRARRSTVVHDTKWVSAPIPQHRWSKDKDEYAIRRTRTKMRDAYKRIYEIGPCCSRSKNHVKRVGRAERSVWSKDKNGVVKSFFIVVHVPALKKRVWCDLEAIVGLAAATDYLIENIGEI